MLKAQLSLPHRQPHAGAKSWIRHSRRQTKSLASTDSSLQIPHTTPYDPISIAFLARAYTDPFPSTLTLSLTFLYIGYVYATFYNLFRSTIKWRHMLGECRVAPNRDSDVDVGVGDVSEVDNHSVVLALGLLDTSS